MVHILKKKDYEDFAQNSGSVFPEDRYKVCMFLI